MQAFNVTTIAILLIITGIIIPLLLRAEVWRQCIPEHLSYRKVLGWTITGFSFNQLIGFRSGDIFRATVLNKEIGLTQGVTSVVLFRSIELVSLCLLIPVIPAALFPEKISSSVYPFEIHTGEFVASAVLLSFALLVFIARHKKFRKHLKPIASLKLLTSVKLILLSLLCFVSEALLLIGVSQIIGQSLAIQDALFLLIVIILGQIVALFPAQIGTFEATLASGIALLGYSGSFLWLLPFWVHIIRLSSAFCLLPFSIKDIPISYFSELTTHIRSSIFLNPFRRLTQ